MFLVLYLIIVFNIKYFNYNLSKKKKKYFIFYLITIFHFNLFLPSYKVKCLKYKKRTYVNNCLTKYKCIKIDILYKIEVLNIFLILICSPLQA